MSISRFDRMCRNLDVSQFENNLASYYSAQKTVILVARAIHDTDDGPLVSYYVLLNGVNLEYGSDIRSAIRMYCDQVPEGEV